MHGMLPESLPLSRGPGVAIPASLLPSDIAPRLRPLSSTGITRRLQYYEPLRHPAGPACPFRDAGWCVHTTETGLPVLHPSPSYMRAAANTPAEPAGASVARFPADGSLPRITAGSASALPFSRPARRSLALRPACSLNRPWRPFSSECFRRCRYLLRPLRLLPAGATVAGRDSHPLRNDAFPRRTWSQGLARRPHVTFPAPAPRTRRADFRHRALQRDHAPRTRIAGANRIRR